MKINKYHYYERKNRSNSLFLPMFLTNVILKLKRRATWLAIACTWMSHTATAQTPSPFAGGDGSAANPYQITTPAQLDSIREDGSNNYLDDHFVLMNDLDFDSYEYTHPTRGWLPIGHNTNNSSTNFNGTKFTGSLNGKGHVIRNLRINRSLGTPKDYIGLFGAIGGPAIIDSLGIDLINVKGRNQVGSLAGIIDGSATVQHSYATGKIKGDNYVGGLAGKVTANATLKQNYAAGQTSGKDEIGGLIGENLGTISNNYALGEVKGIEDIGGLIGTNSGTIDTCYAAANVEGIAILGGLIGKNNSGTYNHNYWNTTINTLSQGIGNRAISPNGVTGLTTTEMYVNTHFNGFDFTNIWQNPNPDETRFPHLRNVKHNGQLLLFPDISPKSITKNNPFTLDYNLLPPTLSSTVTFKSSDETIATVDANGVVTLTKEGKATLTITRDGTDTYAPINASRGLFITPFDGGEGTKNNPYRISTPTQLDFIRNHSDNFSLFNPLNLLDDHYVLTKDLDFDSYTYTNPIKGWQPIGHDLQQDWGFTGVRFTGSLNGKGFTIRHLRINRPNQDYIGLFGTITSNATIDSIALEEVNITGHDYVGSIIGETNDNNNNLSHSYAQGQIKGNNHVGGLIGRLYPQSEVKQSHASIRVSGNDNVGGLVGLTNQEANIVNSYATGLVTGKNNVGGLVGNKEGSIIDSYAAVLVDGRNNIGGLVGKNTNGNYTTSYWNTAISGTTRSVGNRNSNPSNVIPLTTEEMHIQTQFPGFNFENNGAWIPPTTQHFPQLRKVTKNAQAIDFPPITPKKPGDNTFTPTYTLIPPSLPGTNVTFESQDETIATINPTNGEVTIQGKVGATLLTIHRTGNNDYTPLAGSRLLTVHPYERGTGTIDNPYLITTPALLDSIRDNSENGGENYLDDHYALTTDLDFDSYAYADPIKGWQPIGHDKDNETDDHQGTPFTGSFNGKGFSIHNLRINRPNQDYVGLFGTFFASDKAFKIDSLGVENMEIIGDEHVGGLVGNASKATISNSYTAGRVQGNNHVGGLVGHIQESTIKTSYAATQIDGTTLLGGLAGSNNASTIENSYATGSVTGVDKLGGLVGINDGNKSTIENSYAVGRVQGSGDAVGGLIGIVSLAPTHTNNYWNPNISGQTTSAGHTIGEIDSLSTKKMYDKANFSGWDFYNISTNPNGIWNPPTDKEHFPQLRGVTKNGQVLNFLPVPLKAPGSDNTLTLNYALWPNTLTGVDTIFKSANKDVATIDNHGQVTIQDVEIGTATLTIHRTGNDDYAPVSMSRTLIISPFQKGNGTETNPYQVTTPAQLNFIRYHSGGNGNLLNDHYVLTNDLNFSDYEYPDEKGWQPIGHDLGYGGSNTYEGIPFTGSFNGQGHIIRHLRANRPKQNFVGLFGYMKSNFKIDSLGIEEMEIIGNKSVGGLAGGVENGNITNSHTEGSVKGKKYVGGLIGHISTETNNGTISHSYATGQVTARDNEAGGLVGRIKANNYVLKHSYAASQVVGKNNIGGLIGVTKQDSIYNCYALGQATGRNNMGGLVGWVNGIKGRIGNNYAAVRIKGNNNLGGLVGNNDASPNRYNVNYWDTSISKRNTGIGNTADPANLTGHSTTEMYVQTNFSDWDFVNTWLPPEEGAHFPQLRGVTKNGQLLVVPPLEDILTIGTFDLDYTLLPPTLSGGSTVFESSNEAVATIDPNGKVTVKGGNETMITVSRTGNANYAPISVIQRLFAHPYTKGNGTETNPYQVSTPAQLDFIRNHGTENLNFLDDHYVITEDLDFEGYAYTETAKGWLPIGHDTNNSNTVYNGTNFTGTLNGRGHIIQNLIIDRKNEDYVGLFGRIAGSATIDSLGLERSEIAGRNYVGSLAGALNNGTIQHSYALGQVEGNDHVGGLVGSISNNGDLQHTYTVVQVSGNEEVGGLAGFNNGTIDTCYAAGAVAGTTHVGGLTGNNETGTVTASHWNTETSGQATSSGASEGLTTAEMYTEASFVNWNFTDVWIPPMQDKYFPLLRGVGNRQSVSIVADATSITEGEDATFTLTRTGLLISSLSVRLSLTEQGTFLDSSTPSSAIALFSAEVPTASLTVPIADDDIDEVDGSVTVTLEKGSGYTLVEEAKEAIVSIMDNDLPRVSISAEATAVTEGGNVEFTLTRTTPPDALTVNVEVTQQGNYINGTAPTTTSFTDGSLTATLTVATVNDATDEPSGVITATVKPGTEYEVGDPSQAETGIIDNDGKADPEIRIEAVAGSVTEGANAEFTLTRTVTSGTLTVNVVVTQQGNYINVNGTTPATVSFATGEPTATLTIATVNDDTDEPSGVITATIRPGTGYAVSDPSTAEIGIIDDDGTADPEVSIAAVSPSVIEGEDATFTLTREGQTTGILSVIISVTEQGTYISGKAPTMIAFEEGESTVTLTIATNDDTMDEPSGAIMVTVRPGTGYIVGSPSSARADITDDDGAADPEVNIAATSNLVTEGMDASFTLTRTTKAGALTVNVLVTEQGTYVSGTAPTMVTFADNESTTTLTIATEDDNTGETNGTISATIKPGNGYIVGNPSTAEISIADNDVTTETKVRILVTSSSIVEGTDASFTLIRTTTSSTLAVNMEVIQQGNYINGTAPATVSFADGESRATLTIATEDDNTDETDGTITATVKPGTGYGIGNPSIAEVSIIDNDENNPLVGIFNKSEVVLYPNPMKRQLYVRLPQGGQVSIYTLSGRQERMYRIPSSGQEPTSLDLSKLPSGIYIVTLTDDAGQATHYRVMKE